MKRLVTPLILAVEVLFVGGPVSAQDEVEDEGEPEIEIEYADDAVDNPQQEAVEAGTSSDAPVETTGPGLVNFTGVVREKGTRKPIADVTVYLKDTPHEATTDASGRFAFRDLPPGEYTVVIPTTGYETVETTEEIRAGERTEVSYSLEPVIYDGLEVVVRDKRVEKEVSRTKISIEEAEALPGTGGDPVRVIESLPGVARGSGSGGDGMVIRGSNAEDSRIYLDGHWLPMLFHFGGAKSVYNGALLEEFEIVTGGFTAEHGNATGGIVDLTTRDPRDDRWGGYVDLSMIDASAVVEGPITEDMGLALGVRRSTLDLIMTGLDVNEKIDGLNFTTYPVYYDYQGKWTLDIDEHNAISVSAYGLYDKIAFNQNAVNDADPTLTGKASFEGQSHNVAITHHYERGVVESDFSPAWISWRTDQRYGPYLLQFEWNAIDVKEDLRVKLSKGNTLATGLRIQPWKLGLKTNMVRPPKEGDVTFNFSNSEHVRSDLEEWDVSTGGYLQDEITLGKVLVIPGVRFDHLASINAVGVGPRAAVRWQVVQPLVLKASGGLYHRQPDPDEYTPPFGTRDLEFERAVHAVGGLEWAITDTIELDLQGYYKYLDNLVRAVDPEQSDEIYDNGAEGYVFGGEILLRHNWTENFFGWISYSISRSMRNDGPGTPMRRFDMDQTHNLVALASWQFARGWRLGARFQFTSGEPYTQIEGSVFNADNGTYLPIYDVDHKNNETRPPYHRLDLRLDKEWLFDNWVLHTYLDVQNVYYHKNPVATVDNYDYSEQVYQTDIPILPSLGITAEF